MDTNAGPRKKKKNITTSCAIQRTQGTTHHTDRGEGRRVTSFCGAARDLGAFLGLRRVHSRLSYPGLAALPPRVLHFGVEAASMSVPAGTVCVVVVVVLRVVARIERGVRIPLVGRNVVGLGNEATLRLDVTADGFAIIGFVNFDTLFGSFYVHFRAKGDKPSVAILGLDQHWFGAPREIKESLHVGHGEI